MNKTSLPSRLRDSHELHLLTGKGKNKFFKYKLQKLVWRNSSYILYILYSWAYNKFKLFLIEIIAIVYLDCKKHILYIPGYLFIEFIISNHY